MDRDEALIELEGIEFRYAGGADLFRGLSLSVRRGDRLGVVGANGSGKTTLFHIIMGLLAPVSGELWAFGRPVRSEPDRAFVRRHVGFLFQHSDDQLFCPTVQEDVAFGPLNLGLSQAEARDVVRKILSGLHLSDYAERITYRLSGGEKRLIALATALAMEPEVLLLDEPASGLDPRGRRRLTSVLKEIGRTQVISSHDMEFVRATCDRVVVLDGGAVVADGPTDTVLGDAKRMLASGLEPPYSLQTRPEAVPSDHHHGAGPSHGHGHDAAHSVGEHAASEEA